MEKPQGDPSSLPPRPVLVRVPAWSTPGQADWLLHGFSTRLGGNSRVYRPDDEAASDLNLGFTAADDHAIVASNRRLFIDAVRQGKNVAGLVTLRQIHSALIRRVHIADAQSEHATAVLEGDGLMTDEPGILLGIQTADCIPVLLVDTQKRAVAAFHAGWRGTLARIVENGVGRMRTEFGSKPEDLVAAIGPGIGQCCYDIGDEIREQFGMEFSYAAKLFRSRIGPALHLDLAEANRCQLLASGLPEASIHMTGECTGCHTHRFFSHRVERGFTGRMLSAVGIAGN